MDDNILAVGLGSLRGTDSNSLLRLYDRAREIARQSPSRLERARADRAIERLTKELRRRNVSP